MELKNVQLEFNFEAGELHAPVSDLYKTFIYQSLYDCVIQKSELMYEFYTKNLKESFSFSSLFRKTPKSFQEEVFQLLELPLETMYEMIIHKPYVADNINVKNKSNLVLVK